MSDADEPRPGTALVRTGSPAEQEALLLGERFLKRVAALDAAQWGRLDAAAQRLLARDPISRWQRSRYAASFLAALPIFESALVPLGFFSDVSKDVAALLGGVSDWRSGELRGAGRERPGDPRWEQLRSLRAIRERGAHGGDAAYLLGFVLAALWGRDRLPPDAFRRIYAPVEPVIPLASL